MEIEIECLWHTDETRKKDEMGLDLDPNELEARTVTFYQISCVSPSKGWSDGIERCNIWIAGDKFISAYSYDETKSIIENSNK